MMWFFYRIRYWVQYTIGLIAPTWAKAKDLRTYGPKFRWTLRIIVVSLILVVLGFINYWFLPKKWVLTSNEWLREYLWLPLAFLILYALYWLVWWVLKIWGSPEEESLFPDIDKAWDEAMGALNRTGIDPTDAPMFLVLGRTTESEVALMGASSLQFMVKQVPARMDAPLRVYANRDGIFITCAGASLLGRQVALLAGETSPGASEEGENPLGEESAGDKTMRIEDLSSYAQEMKSLLAEAQSQGRGPEDLTEEEHRRIKYLVDREKEEQLAKKGGRPRSSSLRNPAEIDRLKARLKHLCRLIVRERQPFCPLNGILLTIPASATETDEDAKQTALFCQQDLKAARETLEVYCPLFALVCDLNTLPGFGEFIKRFPKEQRQRRVGQRFPLIPDLETTQLEPKLEAVINWISNALIPSWVYRLFRLERAGSDSMDAAVGGNVQLFRFMYQMRERRKRLARILTEGIIPSAQGPLMFGGCYIAGTGLNPDEHAFAAGVFQRLLQDQSYVAWTDAALAAERQYQRWTHLGYVALAVSSLALVGLVVFAVKQILAK